MQLLTTIAVKWSRRTHFEIITCGELGGLVKRATTQLTQGSGDICGVCIVTCGHHLIVELACTRCLKGPIMLSEAAKVFTRDTLQLVGQDCEVSMRRYPRGMHCDFAGNQQDCESCMSQWRHLQEIHLGGESAKSLWTGEDICKGYVVTYIVAWWAIDEIISMKQWRHPPGICCNWVGNRQDHKSNVNCWRYLWAIH